MQLDYASILQGGKSLVPDFRQQSMQDEAFALQRDAMQMQRDEMALKQAKARQAEERQAAFMRDFEDVMRGGGRPDQITTLMMRYPDLMEVMKPALDRMDAQQKERDVGALGAVYTRLSKGDRAGAAAAMRERVQADIEAGLADPADERILAALEGDNEADLGVAMAHIGAELFALAGKDRFEAVFGGAEKTTPLQRDVDYLRSIGRDELAESLLQNKADPVVVGQPGAPIYRSSQFAGTGVTAPQPKGGDQSTGVQGDVLSQMLPITVQSESAGNPNAVSPKGARGLMQVMPATGRNPGFGIQPSNGSQADDIRVGQEYLAEMLRRYDGDPAKAWAAYNAGPGALDNALRGGGGWLRRMPAETRAYVAKNMRALQGQGPARVRSKQQYDRLPSGTQYVAPDGSMRVKP